MHTNPTRLGDLNVVHLRAKQLDRFFDAMAAKMLGNDLDGYTAKSAVTGMTTTNDPALSEPFQVFGRVVAERSAFLKLLPLTVPTTPFIPVPTPVSDPQAVWVGEGHPIPVGRATWSRVTTAESKLATIFVASNELLRTNDPRTRALLTRQASRQLARAIDTTFLGTAAATSSSPAGLLAAAPQLSGGSPANVGRDLAELFAYVSDGRATSPVLILSPRVALYLATLDESLFRSVGVTGGNIDGIPVFTSASAGNLIVLLDPDQLGTFDGGIEVQPSEIAAVQMDTAPTNNAATGVGSTLVSMFRSERLR
jgi:HK97 family phage major capsid protein